jgi:hypothetical protein
MSTFFKPGARFRRMNPFSIRPLPNRAYRISEYPALQ